ncbi:hypothetical protein TGME49_249540 [Toxoplasma gondii ME49]|uniref:Uncharacterized protein n=3 Tax=Toxoplasma gondii TaxID=5811 RepID=B6KHG4_TOXGV|nr:hypothetical protein TGME49_249540 [Toxoplasma gondii ME49]EPT25107.1 hypothetical protein TGME49_249540 [Toxoplasma gondii ME49]ESS34409.1 hypothetical protein TGVEG_249540 [Toxoplasma gondii VEG]CEL78564.1 TPA: hypothetical protein BN1205_002310 [Toxoplasma gondii VEG]|eukprot:XP_002367287.1 hypothetical protein TGME49_249540 [Toxoplasma gondii ME49]
MLSAAQQRQLLQCDWRTQGLQKEEGRSCWYAHHLQQHQLIPFDAQAVQEAHHGQNESQASGSMRVHAPASKSEAPSGTASSQSHLSGQFEARQEGLPARAASYSVQEDQTEHQAALRDPRQEFQTLHFLNSSGAPAMSPDEYIMRQQIFQQQQQLHHLHAQGFPHALHSSAPAQHAHIPSVLSGTENPQGLLHQYEAFPLTRGGGDGGTPSRSDNEGRSSHELSLSDTSRTNGYGVGSEDFRAGSTAPHAPETQGLPTLGRPADTADARGPSDHGYSDASHGSSPLKELEASSAPAWSSSQGGACTSQPLCQATATSASRHFSEDQQGCGGLSGVPSHEAPSGSSESGAVGSAASDHASLSSYSGEPGSFSGGTAPCFPQSGSNGTVGPNLMFQPPPSSVSTGYGQQFVASGRFLVGGYPPQTQACAGGGYGPPGFLNQFGAPYSPHLMHPYAHLPPHQLSPFATSQQNNGSQMDFSFSLPGASGAPPDVSQTSQSFPSLVSASLHHPAHLLPFQGPSTPTRRPPGGAGPSSRRAQKRPSFLATGTPSTTCSPPFNADSLLISASTGLPSEASSLYSGSRRSSAHSALGVRDSGSVAATQERLLFDETGTFATCTPGSSHSRRSSKTAGNARELARGGANVDGSGKASFTWTGAATRASLAGETLPGTESGATVSGKSAVGKAGAGKETAVTGATGNLRGPYAVFATQIAVPPPPELEEACQRLAELKAQPLIQQWLDSRDVSWSFAFALVFNARLAAGSVNVNVRWAREPTVVGGAFLVGKGKTYSWRRAPQEASPHIILQCFEAACKERQKTFGRSQHVDDYLAVLKTDLATAWRLDAEGLQQAADSLVALHGLDIFCGLPVTSKQVKDLLFFDPHANCFSLAPESPPLPPLHFFFPGSQDSDLASDLVLGITKETAALAAPDSVHSSAPPSPSGDVQGFGMRCTYTFRCPAPDCLGLLYTLNRVRLFCLNAKLRSSAAGPSSEAVDSNAGFECAPATACSRVPFSSGGRAAAAFPASFSGALPAGVHTPHADFGDVPHAQFSGSFSRSGYPEGVAAGSGFGGKGEEPSLSSTFASGAPGVATCEAGLDPASQKDRSLEVAAFSPDASLAFASSPRRRTKENPEGPSLYERLVHDGGESLPCAEAQEFQGRPGGGFVSSHAVRDAERESQEQSPSSCGVQAKLTAASAPTRSLLDQEEERESTLGAALKEGKRLRVGGRDEARTPSARGERSDDEKDALSPKEASRLAQTNAGDREAPERHLENSREVTGSCGASEGLAPELAEFGDTEAPGFEGERLDGMDNADFFQEETKSEELSVGAAARPSRRAASRGYAKAKKRRRPALSSSRRKMVHFSEADASVTEGGPDAQETLDAPEVESQEAAEMQEASVQDEADAREKDDEDSLSSAGTAGLPRYSAPNSTLSGSSLAFLSSSLKEPCSERKMDCSAAWMPEEQADRHLEAFFSACVDADRKRNREETAGEHAGGENELDAGEEAPFLKSQRRQEGEFVGVNEGGLETCMTHVLERIEEGCEDTESDRGQLSERHRRVHPETRPSDGGPFFEAGIEEERLHLRRLKDEEKGMEENAGLRFLDDPNTPSLSPEDPGSRGASRVRGEDEEKGEDEGRRGEEQKEEGSGRRRRDSRARRARR